MSQLQIQRNEQKNRQKAFIITTFFYLALIGGIAAYSSGLDISQYLPEQVQEWLPGEDVPAEVEKDRV